MSRDTKRQVSIRLRACLNQVGGSENPLTESTIHYLYWYERELALPGGLMINHFKRQVFAANADALQGIDVANDE